MAYTIHQLARASGVTVRTLHHYDAIGLLSPARNAKNGYREYGERELLRLQQILFFREIDLPLDEVKRILDSKGFDIRRALGDHKNLIMLKRKRLDALLAAIDTTITKITNETTMNDKDLYGSFTKEEMERYTEEARERWGNTDAFKQSEERAKKMGKEGLNRVLEKAGKVTEQIAECMNAGENPTSGAAQKLIAEHYDGLRAFYEPNAELYRGLADMYVADERFAANYEKVAPGLAAYMREAMHAYADSLDAKTA